MKEESSQGTKVFVYGTLKQDQMRFRFVEESVVGIEEGVIRGILYEKVGDYPLISIPEDYILFRGTKDLSSDARQLEDFTSRVEANPLEYRFSSEKDNCVLVKGELFTLADYSALSRFDGIEGFDSSSESLFLRVITPVKKGENNQETTAAWVYVADPSDSRFQPVMKLDKDIWP